VLVSGDCIRTRLLDALRPRTNGDAARDSQFGTSRQITGRHVATRITVKRSGIIAESSAERLCEVQELGASDVAAGAAVVVSLTLTGMARPAARFQARSALTGAGFTTSESEAVLQHPVRRRIIMIRMLVGGLGVATSMASAR
jgi:hypothetical protein